MAPDKMSAERHPCSRIVGGFSGTSVACIFRMSARSLLLAVAALGSACGPELGSPDSSIQGEYTAAEEIVDTTCSLSDAGLGSFDAYITRSSEAQALTVLVPGVIRALPGGDTVAVRSFRGVELQETTEDHYIGSFAGEDTCVHSGETATWTMDVDLVTTPDGVEVTLVDRWDAPPGCDVETAPPLVCDTERVLEYLQTESCPDDCRYVPEGSEGQVGRPAECVCDG